jgi:hypothetical protein
LRRFSDKDYHLGCPKQGVLAHRELARGLLLAADEVIE